MSNTQLTIEEKIAKIKSSENFSDLKTAWYPQSASTSYYFVSYSHKDYKKVFIDILGMQQCDSELAVWYDREFNVGRDWEKEAKTHINDFDCLGVIFYVSENSVKSSAIFKEMQMAMDAGKPFIPIVLPVENISGRVGEYLSGAELLDAIFPQLSETDERYKLYHEMFSNDVLYFKDSDFSQEKTERMKKSFIRQPLLVLEEDSAFDHVVMSVTFERGIMAVNNINVIEVNESDYKFFDANNLPIEISNIGECAFSNCRQLEFVVIPKTVITINKLAFYNCKKLKTVKLSHDSNLECIGDSAFMNCEKLVNITLPEGVRLICNRAFLGCTSLTNVTIPNTVQNIGENAFSGCSSLKDVTIPSGVTSIAERAFAWCTSLTNVVIPNTVQNIGENAFSSCSSLTDVTIPSGVTNIAKNSFAWCKNLTSVTIPNTVQNIGENAFSHCNNLTSIIFDGTIEKWNCICKDVNIIVPIVLSKAEIEVACKFERSNSRVDGVVTVYCTDGTTTIKKFLLNNAH